MKKIKIALADDHATVRDGLAMLLSGESEFKIVASCENGLDLLNATKAGLKPDVAILDIDMPVLNGFKTAKELTKVLPDCKILFLSAHNSALFVEEALNSYADGFVSKSETADTLKETILKVHQTEDYLPVIPEQSTRDTLYYLSDREKEFIRLICLDKDANEITEEMKVKPDRLKELAISIKEKTGVKSLKEIKAKAMNATFL
ncbi:MAG: response regulator [Bacteroidota bacterium]